MKQLWRQINGITTAFRQGDCILWAYGGQFMRHHYIFNKALIILAVLLIYGTIQAEDCNAKYDYALSSIQGANGYPRQISEAADFAQGTADFVDSNRNKISKGLDEQITCMNAMKGIAHFLNGRNTVMNKCFRGDREINFPRSFVDSRVCAPMVKTQFPNAQSNALVINEWNYVIEATFSNGSAVMLSGIDCNRYCPGKWSDRSNRSMYEGGYTHASCNRFNNEYLPGLKSLALNSLRHAKSLCVDKQRLQRRY